MSIALPRLPEPRLAGLMGDYAQSRRAGRRQLLLALLVVAALAFVSAWVAEVDPGQLGRHIGAFFGYFDRITTLEGSTTGARVWTSPGEWFWGLRKWGLLLFDTMLIAYVGTLLGALAGFALCFVSSANLVRQPWLRGTARRLLEFCRTVPDIVFALIFVIAFGLGALPGVLALAIHTTGALGKLFSEVVENIDLKPVDGVTAAGGSWWQIVRFAVVPQVLSHFASYALLRFEINVRGASIMGFVGAGGIGQDLIEAIRKFYFTDVSAILLLIILAVMLIDYGTERLRHALLSLEHGR